MATNNAINKVNPLPSFMARPSSNILNVTGDGTYYIGIFDKILFDNTNSYNNSTGQFIAPIDGYYFFTCCIQFSGLTINHYIAGFNPIINVIGLQNTAGSAQNWKTNTNDLSLIASGMGYLNKGQTAGFALEFAGSTKTVYILTTSDAVPDSWFSGHLIR
jgi:hypothetical protein